MPSTFEPPSRCSAVADHGGPAVAGALDAGALQRLRELDPSGENRVVERVLQAFESSLNRLLQQAQAAEADGDHGTLRHVAHTLKSSSASVGALELSRRCGEIEQGLRQPADADITELLGPWQAEGRRVLDAVRRMLAGAGA